MRIAPEQISAVATRVHNAFRDNDLTVAQAIRLAVEQGAEIVDARRHRVGLTAAQLELLMFIEAHIEENGFPPSFDEMKDAVGLRSKSGIYRLIEALVERGALRRLPNRARALEVVA